MKLERGGSLSKRIQRSINKLGPDKDLLASDGDSKALKRARSLARARKYLKKKEF